MTDISVIIPTYNRLDRLKQVIAALEQQDCAQYSYEVLVISDGSTDGTHAYLEALATPLHLRWVVQPNRGPAAARNTGVHLAAGEFIVFIDDDIVPQPHLLAEHMRVHQTNADSEIVVLGPMLSPTDFVLAPWVRWEQAMLMKQYTAMDQGLWKPTARQFYTGNASLRRRHILEVGGFDEHFRRAEDVELAYRLADRNIGFVFNAAAVGMHYAERSFRSWLEIPYVYGRNDVIFGRDRQQAWLLRQVRLEFNTRHPLIQLLTHICMGRPRVSAATINGLKHLAGFGATFGLNRTTQLVYSGLFSLCYYQGVCDELGDTGFFLRALHQPETSAH